MLDFIWWHNRLKLRALFVWFIFSEIGIIGHFLESAHELLPIIEEFGFSSSYCFVKIWQLNRDVKMKAKLELLYQLNAVYTLFAQSQIVRTKPSSWYLSDFCIFVPVRLHIFLALLV